MKLWELVSAFRAWPGAVREVIGQEPWRGEYLPLLERWDQLVRRQERDILDAPVPLELSRAVAARCPQRFVLDHATWELRRAPAGEGVSPGITILSAAEVHDRFGGAMIEEVFEYGAVGVRGIG